MENVAKLVSRKPPKGLTDCELVRDGLKRWGLVYEAVWIQDCGLEFLLDPLARFRKKKVVEIRCSCCGESCFLPWARTDERYGGYGFLQQDKRSSEIVTVGSGDETVCPICGEKVKVKKAAEVGNGYFVADETSVMSAAVVGKEKYLALTGWIIQRRVYRNARAELKVIPAEAYVFDRADCQKLTGWRNSYSGTAGYFITYLSYWSEAKAWSESWGGVSEIYGLTKDQVAESCLSNCKLDLYMDSFGELKYPVSYLRLYQAHPNVENLLVSGLPLVLQELLAEEIGSVNWEKNQKGMPYLREIKWEEVRPDRMLGLKKEELRLGRDQYWDVLFWRLFTRTKAHGERLTGEDIKNAFLLGDMCVLELIEEGHVARSLRYLLKVAMDYPPYDDPYVNNDEFDDPYDPVPGALPDVTTLLDYWRACRTLGRNLDDRQVRYPRDLIDAHDRAMAQLRFLESRTKNQALAPLFRIRRKLLAKYIFEADGLKIVPAWSQAELQKEGDFLHHCVSSYARRHADGDTAIFFIRRTVEPGRPYYTLELDEKRLSVRQDRGLHNCDKTKAVQAFEDLWISWIRAGAKRDKNGKPIIPKKGQEARSA